MQPTLTAPLHDSDGRAAFRRRLLRWYRRHARDLPWRRGKDAYHVWVSEIMLQQTQVATVVPFFERFIKHFPTVETLAEATSEQVLKQWEGLGYYRRARLMHRAAREIVTHHGGRFPEQIEEVRALPGIGRYTAGAILSIAFEQRHPILEANTIRLLSRLAAYRDDPAKSAGQKYLWHVAEQLLPRNDVGQFNQSLMELGSEICTPREPDCDRCPVQRLCPTNAQGLQLEIPSGKKKVNYEDVHEAVVIVQRRGRVLVRRCGDQERWAGLWDFPRFVLKSSRSESVRRQLVEEVAGSTGLEVDMGHEWKTLKHGVTRFRIRLSCYETTRVRGRLRNNLRHWKWLTPSELAEIPLNVTGRRISRYWIARSNSVTR